MCIQAWVGIEHGSSKMAVVCTKHTVIFSLQQGFFCWITSSFLDLIKLAHSLLSSCRLVTFSSVDSLHFVPGCQISPKIRTTATMAEGIVQYMGFGWWVLFIMMNNLKTDSYSQRNTQMEITILSGLLGY